MELTFAEQVKILLKRRKMTIKDLADLIEAQTGKKMSRQNLTQQLGRDNFQEKDMRLIAGVLGCAMQIAIISDDLGTDGMAPYVPPMEYGGMPGYGQSAYQPSGYGQAEYGASGYSAAGRAPAAEVTTSRDGKVVTTLMKHNHRKKPILGEINPLTGEEYSSNTVRTHPVLSGYVQVYDDTEHKWTDLVEADFLRFQEEKHAMMGKDYEPPIYID